MSELAVGSIAGLAANSFVVDVAAGSQLTQPGMVLQVVSTTKTDTFSTTSTSYVDVTGLSVSITPSSATSKILVMANLNLGNSSTVQATLAKIVRDSTDIAVGTGASTGAFNTGAYALEASTASINESTITYLDSPSTTSSTTYKIQTRVGASSTAYVNRRGVNDEYCTVSSITVMEIAG